MVKEPPDLDSLVSSRKEDAQASQTDHGKRVRFPHYPVSSHPHECALSGSMVNIGRLSTYETKLRDEQHLRKKLKAVDWAAVSQHLESRRSRKSEVRLNGVVIPQTKMKKEIARNSKREARNQTRGIGSSLKSS